MGFNIDTEKYLEKEFTRVIKLNKGLSIKLLSDLKAGLPDRMAIMPLGITYFVEFKSKKGGRLRTSQKFTIAEFIRRGHEVHIISSYKDLINFFKTHNLKLK